MTVSLIAALLFSFAGLVCVGLVMLGLPGGWILLALAAGVELADPMWAGPGSTTIGWGWISGGVALALVGEGLEFVSGLLGAKMGGGTRRGMVGAMAGGFLGAILGTLLVPLPVVGTLVGVFLGTFLGALAGETSGLDARSTQESMKPALAATAARALGLAAKLGITAALWLGLSVAAFAG